MLFASKKLKNLNMDNPTYYGMKGRKLQVTVSAMASVAFLLFGYDQGVMGSLLTLPAFRKQFPTIDTSIHPDQATMQGFTIAVYEVGCLMGALTTIYIGDKIGRLRCMFWGCIIMMIGAALQASAFTVGHLIAARVITGIGNGFNTATVPMWQSECAKPAQRGRLVMLSGALITGGIMVSYWVDFGFYFTSGDISWRFPVAFQIIFPLLICPFILNFPESPRWLAKQGRFEEAAYVFAAIEGTSTSAEEVLIELNDVKESLNEEHLLGGDSLNWNNMFQQGKHRNFQRLMLGSWCQVFQQITGINLITYYAGTIFETYIGMSALNSRILAACNGTEYFLASFVAFFVIERLGRRKLMLFGLIGQTITMGMLTCTTWLSDHRDDKAASYVAAVLLFVFNTFFAIGWLGMSWLYQAEIPPLSIRAQSNAISTGCNWAFNFMVVMITPVCFENIGSWTYTVFAGLNAAMIPAVYFFFPETAGRSLEEMDNIFAECDTKRPWDIVAIANKYPRLGHKHVDESVFYDEKAYAENVETASQSEE